MSMSNEQTKRGSWEHFLLRAAKEISLSEAQYEKINDRYSQLEKILNASDNPLLAEAHIFVQGSMRLKTTIKPVSGAPEDLDTIDADAIIWLPHAQGAGAREVLDAIEERFKAGSRVQEEIKQLRRGIRIVAHQRAKQAHFFLHQGGFLTMGKHRVQVDDLGRLAFPVAHQLDGIALEQVHAGHDRPYLGVLRSAGQAVFQ